MLDKVQKIRKEVEIVVSRRLNLLNGDYFDLNEETNGFTNEIMNIIDSLQEEPVSEGLEEATNNYCVNVRKGYPRVMDETDRYICNAFKAGAKWQKEQLLAKAVDAHCFGFQGAALFTFRLPANKYLVGSEVKVILVKED